MNAKNVIIVACLIMLCLLVLIFRDDWSGNDSAEPEKLATKTLKFVFEVTNNSNNAVKDSSFSAYLPIISASQIVDELKVSQEYAIKESEDGNRVLESGLGLMPPYGTKKITVAAKVSSYSLVPSKVKPQQVYLDREKYIEIDNPKILSLAEKLAGNTKAETASNIFSWLTKNIDDSGYTSQDKGALYVLESGKGDCTEFMYLTIALARANGIYARGVGGYVYSQSSLVKSSDYHNWAELFYDGQWNVIDAQKKVLLDESGKYISMRYLSDKKLSLLGSSHRFTVVDKNLVVKML